MGIEEGTFWDEHWVLYGNQFDNKLYLIIESSLQLTLYKRVNKKFKNFKDLFQSVANKDRTQSLLF